MLFHSAGFRPRDATKKLMIQNQHPSASDTPAFHRDQRSFKSLIGLNHLKARSAPKNSVVASQK